MKPAKFNLISLSKELNANKKSTVIIWVKYLKAAGKPLISSKKPINANGKQMIAILLPNNKFPIDPKSTKETPPPLGVGWVWELLLFGLSRILILRKSFILKSINEEQKKQLKATKTLKIRL